jgi:hypothetical protein
MTLECGIGDNAPAGQRGRVLHEIRAIDRIIVAATLLAVIGFMAAR